MSIADELKKFQELLDAGLVTREEFEEHKQALLEGRALSSTSMPHVSAEHRMQLGAYKILAKVGEGGMGAVYRARHVQTAVCTRQGGDVAIKIMHPQYARRDDFRARFEREADLGLRLRHDNLVVVHDLVVDGDQLALVMEWIQGRPLSKMIGEEIGPIPWEQAWPLFEQILRGVAYAHGEGVVHRDLKPENVMVAPDGAVKVLDFGIAKSHDSGKTKTGTGLGTVDYMAPEQYRDAKAIDHRADIYALGMTLYEMLAGRLPWDASVPEFEILVQKSEGRLPPPTQFYPSVPPHVVDVVMRCLEVRPEQRPATTEALLAALLPSTAAAEVGVSQETSALDEPASVLKETPVSLSLDEELLDLALEDDPPVDVSLETQVLGRQEAVPIPRQPGARPDVRVAESSTQTPRFHWMWFALGALFLLMVGVVASLSAVRSTFVSPLALRTPTEVFTSASTLNVRSAPVDGDVVHQLPYGTKVRSLPTDLRTEVEGVSDVWHQVFLDDETLGYAWGGFLVSTLGGTSEPPKTMLLYRNTWDELNTSKDYLELSEGRARWTTVTARGREFEVRFQQEGTFEVLPSALDVRLAAADGKRRVALNTWNEREETVEVNARLEQLTYRGDLKGWVTTDTMQRVSGNDWSYREDAREYRRTVDCQRARGKCTEAVGVWHVSDQAIPVMASGAQAKARDRGIAGKTWYHGGESEGLGYSTLRFAESGKVEFGPALSWVGTTKWAYSDAKGELTLTFLALDNRGFDWFESLNTKAVNPKRVDRSSRTVVYRFPGVINLFGYNYEER